jgi:CubicO group peptidase (beta-lactamase class C family)
LRRRFCPAVDLAILAALVAVILGSVAASAAGLPAAPDFGAIDDYVRGQMNDAGIPGVALGIVHGDTIVHLQGFGRADAYGRAVTSQTPFVLGSVSKTFTALATMQLVDANKIDLDAPVQRYLPWFRVATADAAARITVRDLLKQTSGLPTAAGTEPLHQPSSDLEAQVRALANVTLTSAPGSTYTYSNANYEVLGLIVEAVSGESYASYIERHIFVPLDMRHSYTSKDAADRDGLSAASVMFFGRPLEHSAYYRADFVPAGWLISSAEDLTHYLVAQINNGRYGNASVLSAAGVEELHHPAAPIPGSQDAYAMGWVVGPATGDLPLIWHDGSSFDMYTVALIEPEQRWGVVMLFNATSAPYELVHKHDAIAVGVASQLVGRRFGGTFEGLYVAFDLAVGVVTLLQVRSLWWLLLPRPARPPGLSDRLLGGLGIALPAIPAVGLLWAIYAHLVMPVALLFAGPAILHAPWPDLVRTDLGLWLVVYAVLRLIIGLARLARAPRLRQALAV